MVVGQVEGEASAPSEHTCPPAPPLHTVPPLPSPGSGASQSEKFDLQRRESSLFPVQDKNTEKGPGSDCFLNTPNKSCLI